MNHKGRVFPCLLFTLYALDRLKEDTPRERRIENGI